MVTRGSGFTSLVACWSMLLVALGTAGATAGQRTVLMEDFTATWCTWCPYVGNALGNIMDDPNSQGRFVVIQIHGDDMYTTPWGNQRIALYTVDGYPTTEQDGVLEHVGSPNPDPYNPEPVFRADFEARRAVPTTVTLRLGGVLLTGQTYRINAAVGMEATGTPRSVRVQIIAVLDHYPSSGTHYRNCVRQAATYEDVNLVPGQSHLIQRDFAFSGTDWTNRTNLRIVAFAQDINSPLEVHQAALMPWPFKNDCNSNGIADETDIGTGTSHDCNGNGIPDECDIAAFWDGNPAFHDCDLNGYPDGCQYGDLTDCDENGYVDACEIATHGLDCNSNGVLDVCDIATGVAQDCNENDIPDTCDLARGTSEDCNNNLLPDECDVNPNIEQSSAQLTPLGGVTQTYTLVAPPNAVSDVTLDFIAFGDLNYSNENVAVDINGTNVGTVYYTGTPMDCDPSGSEDALTVPAATFNSLKAGGNAVIHMVPSPGVNPTQCDPTPTWIRVTVSYVGVPRSQDANHNGIPDECEPPPGCKADSNCDAAISWRDIDYFVAAMNDAQSAWWAKFLPGTPPCPYSNNDTNDDGHVTWRDINPFVSRMNQTCP